MLYGFWSRIRRLLYLYTYTQIFYKYCKYIIYNNLQLKTPTNHIKIIGIKKWLTVNFWIAHIKKLKYLRYLQGVHFTFTICSYLLTEGIVVTLTSQKNIFRTLQKILPKSTSKNSSKTPKTPKKIRPKPSHKNHKYHKHPHHKTHNTQEIPDSKTTTNFPQNTSQNTL